MSGLIASINLHADITNTCKYLAPSTTITGSLQRHCGFDDSPESRIVDPSLTTIHIHSQIMGLTAVQLLATRIQDQSLNFRVVHTETNLLYRKSTGD